jgi:uncharacterized membrane protein YjgN (DUF898 family)
MDEDNQHIAASAFQFHGNWKAFFPIILSNILLTIVTLGVYRFWATTRERKYLWSQTEFIDDRLEWTGTGLELLIGFFAVMVLIFLPLIGINLLQAALIARGIVGFAGLLTFALLFAIFYLTGIARFRGLRYKLSRTYWHGIRGGSNDQGLAYGWAYVWKTFVGGIALYLMVPWAMMSLWNERWGRMSFGPHEFFAKGEHGDTFKRFLSFYLLPLAAVIAGVIASYVLGTVASAAIVGLLVIGVYFGLAVVAIAYYAIFFRTAIDGLSLHTLDFNFAARTKDWFILFLGDIALWIGAAIAVLVPLGAIAAAVGTATGFSFPDLGASGNQSVSQMYLALLPLFAAFLIPVALVGPFIRYRHWKFFIDHMHAYGEINLDELTQSETKTAKHGEGLLDAFDVGAI